MSHFPWHLLSQLCLQLLLLLREPLTRGFTPTSFQGGVDVDTPRAGHEGGQRICCTVSLVSNLPVTRLRSWLSPRSEDASAVKGVWKGHQEGLSNEAGGGRKSRDHQAWGEREQSGGWEGNGESGLSSGRGCRRPPKRQLSSVLASATLGLWIPLHLFPGAENGSHCQNRPTEPQKMT